MIDLEYIRLKREEVSKGHILQHTEGLRLLQMLEGALSGPPPKRIVIDESDGNLFIDGIKIVGGLPYHLSMVAKCLAERAPRFQTRNQLITYAYGEGWAIEDRSIDSHLKRLRRMLPKDCPISIVTRYGVGYAMLFKGDSEITSSRSYASVIKSPLLR